ncbi:hypothetical protein DFJ77DRAFT_490853 [Powellomyces hirtus]|nr:hypothetical protein DFJ77DRAFT_490853 [Powellomyces hirtus]
MIPRPPPPSLRVALRAGWSNIVVSPSSCIRATHRAYSSSPSTYPALVYDKYGRHDEILKVAHLPLPPVSATSVNVKFLASPINPADINQLQGTYPLKPPFNPTIGGAIGGNEGVAEVISVGDGVRGIHVGDWVIPVASGSGTWRTHAQYEAEDVLKLESEGVSKIIAATISVNPSTAYRMLKDFENLQPGDVVIQNGANSGVGQSVIQLAKAWGFRTVNIVRQRPALDELKHQLHALGADMVITEEDARRTDVAAQVKQLGPPPRLALNCVGGKSATNMVRLLGHDAHLVTYGGMSKEPVTLPTSAFIFKNLSAHGFWMTRWYDAHSHDDDQRARMLSALLALARTAQLKEPWHDVNSFRAEDPVDRLRERAVTAIDKAVTGFGSRKQIFEFE